MPTCHRFHQLDVFTPVPLKGNPLAVVHDAEGLDDATLAAFARWTNLSETTFLLPPTPAARAEGADYRVRIFTPGGELPFAGHPTLGSCQAWLLAGGRPRRDGLIVQECGVGLVRIRRDGTRLAFAAPPLRRSGPLEPALVARIARGLGLGMDEIVAHQWVDNGPGWCAVMLGSAAQVLALRPDPTVVGDLKLGVVGPQPAGQETAFEVRAFVGSLGVPEDPVTGSLNAGLAQWLIGVGLAPPCYVAAQGAALGRAGRVHVSVVDNEIWVGGDVVACIEGRLDLSTCASGADAISPPTA
jgi:PhzF family phenazine biosynthesis protein